MKEQFIAFRYKQFNQEFLSLILPFRVISGISKVLVYGEDDFGYQRKLNSAHVKGIKESIIKENVILPTSIVLGANKDDINKLIKLEDKAQNIVHLEMDINEVLFRIIDGQHRLKGLEEAQKSGAQVSNFMLNVIIVLTENFNRVVEVEVFENINSKAKRIKTDLTLLAKYNYELLGQKDIKDINIHIAVKTAYYLNEEISDSVWHKAIQFEFNKENYLGIIGVNAFINSISTIVKEFLRPHSSINSVKDADSISRDLAYFINKAWNIIRAKWPNCFTNRIERDLYDFVSICYDEKYYLQKTTGTNAIHLILFDCVSECQGFDDNTLDRFHIKISASNLKTNDWQVGGIFTGMTSQSGFRKAKDIIEY